MKHSIYLFSVLFMFLLVFTTCTRKDDFSLLKGPYLGQKPPGMTPEIFAPGIISTNLDERIAAFTPDGKEFYFV